MGNRKRSKHLSCSMIAKLNPYAEEMFDLYWNWGVSFAEISKILNVGSPSSVYRYFAYKYGAKTRDQQLAELKEKNTGRVWTESAKENVRQGVLRSYMNEELHKKRSEANKRIWSKMSHFERVKRTHNGMCSARNKISNIVISGIERKVSEQLDFIGIHYIQQKELLCGRFYVDFYIPSLNLVVECNGDYWHKLPNRIQRDKDLKEYVESCGKNIIFIWEHEINDEWFWIGDYLEKFYV